MERDKVKALLIEKIREIKSSVFEDVLDKISEENLLNDLGLDSLDFEELIQQLENEFGIEITEEDANDLKRKPIGFIIDYISDRVKKDEHNRLFM